MFKKHLLKICLDFDGVIHQYTSGWKGPTEIPDPPVPGAFEAIYKYMDHFEVNIYSSRSRSSAGISAMIGWFIKHGFRGINELEFPDHKPNAFVTIDDRGITFDGNFPDVETIKTFKPWNRK